MKTEERKCMASAVLLSPITCTVLTQDAVNSSRSLRQVTLSSTRASYLSRVPAL